MTTMRAMVQQESGPEHYAAQCGVHGNKALRRPGFARRRKSVCMLLLLSRVKRAGISSRHYERPA